MNDADSKLSAYRKDINEIDDKLVKLFIKRMETAGKIGALNKEAGLPDLNVNREEEVKKCLTKDVPEIYKESVNKLYDALFAISREHQESLK
ncbi:MAG: chorismate mutase [Lachnospiraceae bacterium]|nr:chorismate mutase [Lachnospiraceae bacterium]